MGRKNENRSSIFNLDYHTNRVTITIQVMIAWWMVTFAFLDTRRLRQMDPLLQVSVTRLCLFIGSVITVVVNALFDRSSWRKSRVMSAAETFVGCSKSDWGRRSWSIGGCRTHQPSAKNRCRNYLVSTAGALNLLVLTPQSSQTQYVLYFWSTLPYSNACRGRHLCHYVSSVSSVCCYLQLWWSFSSKIHTTMSL